MNDFEKKLFELGHIEPFIYSCWTLQESTELNVVLVVSGILSMVTVFWKFFFTLLMSFNPEITI